MTIKIRNRYPPTRVRIFSPLSIQRDETLAALEPAASVYANRWPACIASLRHEPASEPDRASPYQFILLECSPA
jgi:hypothetical protein